MGNVLRDGPSVKRAPKSLLYDPGILDRLGPVDVHGYVHEVVQSLVSEATMKTVSVRDFREHVADHLDGSEPVLVTRNGRHAAVLFPIEELRKLPLEYRRKLFLDVTADVAKQLDTKGVSEEDIQSAFASHKKNRRR